MTLAHPKFIFFGVLALIGLAMDVPNSVQFTLPNYEVELRYWRQLPYPRVEKLMNIYGGKVDMMWVCQDNEHRVKVAEKDFNENNYSVVIDFWRDVNGKPTINEITKREETPEGTIVRKSRISVLGPLQWEQGFLNGKRHGIWSLWYPDGKPECIWSYVNGQPDGLARTYSPDGKLLQECLFSNGKIMTASELDSEGKWLQVVTKGTGGISTYNNGVQDGGVGYVDGVVDQDSANNLFNP